MKALYVMGALALTQSVCFAAAKDDGGTDFWEKRFKAVEKDIADLKAQIEKDGKGVDKRFADLEKSVNQSDRDGDTKADKSVGGRLAAIERHVGLAQKAGDPTVDNDGNKLGEDGKPIKKGADNPSSPESDKKAGKV